MLTDAKSLRQKLTRASSRFYPSAATWVNTLASAKNPGRDYGCEILALVVLTALSALSHFWLIMIAICAAAAFAQAGVLLSRVFFYGRNKIEFHLIRAPRREDLSPEAGLSDGPPRAPGQRLRAGTSE
jgi:hypothetical protein